MNEPLFVPISRAAERVGVSWQRAYKRLREVGALRESGPGHFMLRDGGTGHWLVRTAQIARFADVVVR